jgi:hypothetical protein
MGRNMRRASDSNGVLSFSKEVTAYIQPAGRLFEDLRQIPDPRARQGVSHNFEAMLATIVCDFYKRRVELLQSSNGFAARSSHYGAPWAIAAGRQRTVPFGNC